MVLMTVVVMGARPRGRSFRVEMVRSPKLVRAMVRGMGVAVMTSVWGVLSAGPL